MWTREKRPCPRRCCLRRRFEKARPCGPSGCLSGYIRARTGARHHDFFQTGRADAAGYSGHAAGIRPAMWTSLRKWSARFRCWTMRSWSSAARTASRRIRRRSGSWLARHNIPTFVFVNKMDIQSTDRAALLAELKSRLDAGCVDFGAPDSMAEEIAMCDETLLERFLESGQIEDREITALVHSRKVFPCYFGLCAQAGGRAGAAGWDRPVCLPAGI